MELLRVPRQRHSVPCGHEPAARGHRRKRSRRRGRTGPVPGTSPRSLRADDCVLREIEETLQAAEGSSGDTALSTAKFFLGIALTSREAAADRDRGLELVVQVCDVWVRERTRLYLAPSAQAVAARERARRGEPDGAIPVMRTAVNDLFETGQLTGGVLAAARLVEMLVDRGAHGDAAEAAPRSTGWRTCRLPKVGRFAIPGYCGYGRCSPEPAATTLPTMTW